MRLLFSFLLCVLSAAAQAAPVKVAVTDPLYAEWVETIGGENVEAVLVTEDTTEGLEGAALIYETGLGKEPWLTTSLEGMEKAPRRIVLSDGIPTMTVTEAYWTSLPLPHPNPEKMPECCRKDAADTNAAWQALVEKVPTLSNPRQYGYDPEAVDTHIWFNPLNAQGAVLVINETLAELAPEQADSFDQNAYAYLEDLSDLDGWVKSRIRDIPMNDRVFVTQGGSFRYYAKHYGLAAPLYTPEYMGLAFVEKVPGEGCESCTCDGPKLFTATGPDGPDTYVALMRQNTETITEALVTQPAG